MAMLAARNRQDRDPSPAGHGVTSRAFNALVENLRRAVNAEGVPFRARSKLLAKPALLQRDAVTRQAGLA